MRRYEVAALIVWGCLWLGLVHSASAQIPRLADVPEVLPAETRGELTKVKSRLLEDKKNLQAKAQRLKDQCTDVTQGTALAGQCAKDQAEVEGEKQRYIDDANAFKLRVEEAVSVRIKWLTAQIDETKHQLANLGFDDRTSDFERLGEISATEQAHITAQLLGQLKDLVLAKGEKAMEDYFLDRIKAMKPQQVKALANKLQKAGADDPIFQQWLLSFSPSASREVLASGARETIKYLKKDEKLFKLDEQLDRGTVEARQDAALTLLSLVAENPALTELKAVAAGLYTVGEAGVYLYVLGKSIDHLNDITAEQLTKQAVLIKRIKELVRDRSRLMAEL